MCCKGLCIFHKAIGVQDASGDMQDPTRQTWISQLLFLLITLPAAPYSMQDVTQNDVSKIPDWTLISFYTNKICLQFVVQYSGIFPDINSVFGTSFP